jgi:hypothetical protein
MLGCVAAVSGCSDSPRAVISVDAVSTLADRPVRTVINDLPPGAAVIVTAETTDGEGRVWRSRGEFRAGDDGTVDLTRVPSTGGTYSGADGMGLFWSMQTAVGGADHGVFAGDSRPPLKVSTYG